MRKKKQDITEERRERIISDLYDFIVKQDWKEKAAKDAVIFAHNLNIKTSDTNFWRPILAEMWALNLPSRNQS